MTKQINGSTRKALIAGGVAFLFLLAGWIMVLNIRVADARELAVRLEASTSRWLSQLEGDILEIKMDLREIKSDVKDIAQKGG